MHVLIAPDSFAGTLSAHQAAVAMAAGWSRARPDDDVRVVPMADGGAGTVDVVAAARGDATVHTVEVADAAGIATQACWLLLPDGRALVEAAQACGLEQLDADQRNPLRTTTYGVGQLLRAAAEAGAREIVVGLGGTATVDGGVGMAIALGHRLRRADRNGVRVGGAWVGGLERIHPGPGLGVPVVAAYDVANPLLGPDGAATVFAPQKGADDEAVAQLEDNLRHLAAVAERELPGGPWRDLPGAGAAGGLGFGLFAFCGADGRPGAAVVAGLVGLDVAGADVVLTGEGALDAQTGGGKVPAFLAARARVAGARVMAIVGRVADGAQQPYDAVVELGPEGPERAAELVCRRAAELAASYGSG